MKEQPKQEKNNFHPRSCRTASSIATLSAFLNGPRRKTVFITDALRENTAMNASRISTLFPLWISHLHIGLDGWNADVIHADF